jgi:hypothetical protein
MFYSPITKQLLTGSSRIEVYAVSFFSLHFMIFSLHTETHELRLYDGAATSNEKESRCATS